MSRQYMNEIDQFLVFAYTNRDGVVTLAYLVVLFVIINYLLYCGEVTLSPIEEVVVIYSRVKVGT
ncbi:hypothetical protein CsSME_00007133 [Camellia sinensis var. sinensis]